MALSDPQRPGLSFSRQDRDPMPDWNYYYQILSKEEENTDQNEYSQFTK
jgi:hypothetical protein